MKNSDGIDFHALLKPAPMTAKFIDPDYYIWCGTMMKGDDGMYHLFYSRWPRKLGHYAWVTHSEIAHAVSPSPFGPFTHADVALTRRDASFWDGLCTHNPTIQRFDGKWYLYYMGNTGDDVVSKDFNWNRRNNQRVGVAVADTPSGPWRRFDTPLIDVTPGFHDALCTTNPSVTRRPDGGYLMVYKGVGMEKPLPSGGPVVHLVATADSPTGPFVKHPNPVFTKSGIAFAAEDPFIWYDRDRYRAIVKDMAGHFTDAGKSLVQFESSDGLTWTLAEHPLVSRIEVAWENGIVEKLHSLERPQLLIVDGILRALLCAADVNDKREHSFNLQIPLAPYR
ncbi:MAG: glycoside hydrolase family protein [Spirochaetes bacterium]|nr:glycoside hydrolase family protein [Spirochaetota bacterium]